MSAEQWQIYAALRDARSIYDDPFFDPDFARLVGEVREDTRIGFASDGDGVFAVWPLHIRPGNWARPIGSPFSDWNAPILSEDTELTPHEILAGFDISGMTTSGFMPASFAPNPALQRAGANLADLSHGAETFLAEQQNQWPKHFKKMRRVYRNVERDFSSVRFNWDDRSDANYQRLLALKQQQFLRTGYHNVLKAPWTRALFDRLRSFEGARLRSRLVTLSFDDKFAAAEYNLQSDRVLHGWITAFEQDYSRYSPGNMLVQELLEKMAAEGLTIYDAGPGYDHYKRHYANVQSPVESGVIQGNSNRLHASRMAGQAWRFGEQVMPGKASAIMARARRRMDQIASVETTFSGRASGIFRALNARQI
ncbi:MAG: GNAT family N-acetyltransferase [Henriciella sp.]